jgi:glyoxylase-like metal-dependent hydrolase (beta-lactamase superfamily II)
MEKIQLGDTVLTTRLTPGHTKGCLTWTMKVRENDKEYDLVFVGSVSAPGYRLVDNPQYPAIAGDFAHSFAVLKSLPCDIFVSYHGGFFQMDEKIQRRKENPAVNPFVDPQATARPSNGPRKPSSMRSTRKNDMPSKRSAGVPARKPEGQAPVPALHPERIDRRSSSE